MTSIYNIANDLNEKKETREVAKLMYEGYHWDFIKEKLGDSAGKICADITRRIDQNHVGSW